MGERTLEVVDESSCWQSDPQERKDRAASGLMRGSQDEPLERRTKESYESLSIASDPVGDWAAARIVLRQEQEAYEATQVALVVTLAYLAEMRGDPADLDYRLASLVAFACRSELPRGFAAGLARSIERAYPGLLARGRAKFWAEAEEAAAERKAHAAKAWEASKEKRRQEAA